MYVFNFAAPVGMPIGNVHPAPTTPPAPTIQVPRRSPSPEPRTEELEEMRRRVASLSRKKEYWRQQTLKRERTLAEGGTRPRVAVASSPFAPGLSVPESGRSRPYPGTTAKRMARNHPPSGHRGHRPKMNPPKI